MFNLYGVDVTKKPGDEGAESGGEIAGKALIRRRVSPATELRIEEAMQEQTDIARAASPRWIRPVIIVLLLIAGIITGGVISALKTVSLAEAYRNAPVLINIGATAYVLMVTLSLYRRRRMRNALESTELRDHIKHIGAVLETVREELHIPADAIPVDVLMEHYTVSGGEAVHRDFGICGYLNLAMFAFVEGGALCLSSNYDVMEIPLSSLRRITRAPKAASFPQWNKEDAPGSPAYSGYGVLHTRNVYYAAYYTVEISDAAGEFALLIPVYDIEAIAGLTGLPMPDTEK